jgi:MarR family transcriptional regulator, transcriptional regulator for hemolysin
LDSLEQLGFLLEDAARLYERRFREHSRELSLEPAHCRALLVLADNAGISQTALADLCGLSGSHVTRVVDLLELCGWAERHPHPNDRRAHLLSVTPNATQVLRRICGSIDGALSQALQNLSAQEISTLLHLLGQLRANLSGTGPVTIPITGGAMVSNP